MSGPLNPPSDPVTMDAATPISSSSSLPFRRIMLAVALCSSFVNPASSFAFSVGGTQTPTLNSPHADLSRTTRTDLRNLGSSSRLLSPTSKGGSPPARSSTSLSMVWWFGGTENQELTSSDDDSCELVAVRIERTSANSRRIGGEIVVDRPIDDAWAILTDYDNLSVHVPNLVESRRVSGGYYDPNHVSGEQGDGKYKCRLYQKGAQKIVGFQFGASVTMDMAEAIADDTRKISFKCVESQFFSEFDGEWTATETTVPDELTGEPVVATNIKYVVDVRPKGPVPVAALEWRIREDVPTNLRAVKKAAADTGLEGVLAMRQRMSSSAVDRAIVQNRVRSPATRRTALQNGNKLNRTAAAAVRSAPSRVGVAGRTARKLVGRAGEVVTAAAVNASQPRRQLAPVRVDWYEDETMAAYLNEIEP